MHMVTEMQNVDLFDVIRLYLRPGIYTTMFLSTTYHSIARTALLVGLLQLF